MYGEGFQNVTQDSVRFCWDLARCTNRLYPSTRRANKCCHV